MAEPRHQLSNAGASGSGERAANVAQVVEMQAGKPRFRAS